MAAEGDDDFDLFRRTMEANGIREGKYRSDQHSVEPRRRLPAGLNKTRQRLSGAADMQVPSPPAAAAIDQTENGPAVLFVRSGVEKRLVKSLRQGTLNIDESLDLHGMRSLEAGSALERFVAEALSYGLRCVQIIHGKGYGSEHKGGVLKPQTIHWLKQQPEVIAFCSAIPSQGGSGATNVLLRR